MFFLLNYLSYINAFPNCNIHQTASIKFKILLDVSDFSQLSIFICQWKLHHRMHEESMSFTPHKFTNVLSILCLFVFFLMPSWKFNFRSTKLKSPSWFCLIFLLPENKIKFSFPFLLSNTIISPKLCEMTNIGYQQFFPFFSWGVLKSFYLFFSSIFELPYFLIMFIWEQVNFNNLTKSSLFPFKSLF